MPDKSKISGGPSSGILNPTLNETYEFIDTVISDFKTIFSKSEFIHLGGDEVETGACWEMNTQIKSWMDENSIKDGSELFYYFQKRVGELAKQKNVQTAHWVYDDNWSLKWDKGSILQYWGKSENIPKLKETYAEHQHILSVHDLFYFDCGLGNRYGTDLCNPYQTWARIRVFEPTEFYAEGSDQLLGGEGCMWSELNTPYNIFNKIFPKLAVISSIFWSEKLVEPYKWGDIVEELVSFRDYLKENGVEANQVSSRYCEVHPHEVFKKLENQDLSFIEQLFS